MDTDTYMLFDLDRDPGETNDLAGDAALLSEVQRSYVAFTSKIADFTPKRTIPYPSDKRSSRTSGGLASTGHMP
jgi:hypothetical protein